MTPAERAAARQRCEAATKGTWQRSSEESPSSSAIVAVDSEKTCDVTRYNDLEYRDHNFIIHARTDLPAALDEIERLEKLAMRLCPAQLPVSDPECPYAGGACPVHT